jgi:hypothetical protein
MGLERRFSDELRTARRIGLAELHARLRLAAPLRLPAHPSTGLRTGLQRRLRRKRGHHWLLSSNEREQTSYRILGPVGQENVHLATHSEFNALSP